MIDLIVKITSILLKTAQITHEKGPTQDIHGQDLAGDRQIERG